MTPETHIIENSNLSRSQLLAIRRNYVEGRHYVRSGRGGRIEWTDDGIAALAEELGPSVSIEDLTGEVPEEMRGGVTLAGYTNKTLIQAKLDGIEERVLVKVRDALMYVPGMPCEVRRNGERGWQEAKRPRVKGRF